jgi:ribosomal protein L2
MNPSNQGIYARAAGTYCILLKTIVDEKLGELKSIIRLPSNKLITVSSDSLASIGQVSNPDHNLIVKGKAGVNR